MKYHGTFIENTCCHRPLPIVIGIEPLKTRHDVTKLNFTVLGLSLLCIHIDLRIQLISRTLYMICVY